MQELEIIQNYENEQRPSKQKTMKEVRSRRAVSFVSLVLWWYDSPLCSFLCLVFINHSTNNSLTHLSLELNISVFARSFLLGKVTKLTNCTMSASMNC